MRFSVMLSLPTGCLSVCMLAAVVHAQPFERKWYLGVEAHPTTRGYEVRSVTPDSPAHKANLHRGDFIRSVNGIEVGYIGNEKYYPLVAAFNKSGGKATLVVSFVTVKNQWRKYEPTVQLVKRGTTLHPPHELQIMVEPSGATVNAESREGRQTPEPALSRPSRDLQRAVDNLPPEVKTAVATQLGIGVQRTEERSPDEDERVNRDERGVADELFANLRQWIKDLPPHLKAAIAAELGLDLKRAEERSPDEDERVNRDERGVVDESFINPPLPVNDH